MHKQSILKVVFSLGLFFIYNTLHVVASPSAAEYGVVLNLSGKQRMLTQKMSKEILLINLGIDTEENVKNLKNTSALFDKTLKGLKDGDDSLKLPPTSEKRIIRQLGKVKKIWDDFGVVVQQIVSSKKVTKEQIDIVAKQNLPLLKQMNKCVRLYEKNASKAGLKSDPGLAVTINLAGKQRMLTQKMSKEFLLIASGHDVEANQLNLEETYTLFERTLLGLEKGDQTLDLPETKNKEIVKQLHVVAKLWQSFKPLVVSGSKNKGIKKSDIQSVAKNNLPLLKNMNMAVKMYEKEAAK